MDAQRGTLHQIKDMDEILKIPEVEACTLWIQTGTVIVKAIRKWAYL